MDDEGEERNTGRARTMVRNVVRRPAALRDRGEQDAEPLAIDGGEQPPPANTLKRELDGDGATETTPKVPRVDMEAATGVVTSGMVEFA